MKMSVTHNLRKSCCVIVTLCASLALHAPVQADERTDRIEALEKRLDESLKFIDRLTARVIELERSQGVASRPLAGAALPAASPSGVAVRTAEAAEQAREIAQLQDQVDQLSDGLSKAAVNPGLPLHGFADVGAGWSTQEDPMRLSGFNAGTLDLYLVPQFGSRVRSLVEVAFEYDQGGIGSGVDVERLQIGYTLNDDLTVWFGRFHTPFGLWNTWFHHGANLQTSIYRPRFIEFEDKGGIIPAHSVGVWASGKFALGGDKVTYDGYLSNGPSIRKTTLEFNPFTDDDRNKMAGFNIGYHPSGPLNGLSIGLHGFASTATAYSQANTPLNRTHLRMGGAYLGYDTNDWEVISEYYRFHDSDVGQSAARESAAWFAQVGKTFGSWTPYIRYERAILDLQDYYFISQSLARPYRRASIGARYALDSRSSFKFELSNTREDSVGQINDEGGLVLFNGIDYRRASFQYSIAF